MTTIVGLPPRGGAPGEPHIISTRLIFMAHKSAGVAGAINVQVSAQLPTPCVINGFSWTASTQSAATRTHTAALYLSNNDSLLYDDNTLGERLTSHRDAGTIPPDPDAPNPLEIGKAFPDTEVWVPLWVPVYQSPTFIKSAARQSALGAIVYWFMFSIALLDKAPIEPGVDITPRGTPDQPVCVNICGITPGAIPGVQPAPAPPTPAPTPPTPAPALDPLQLPLPAPCPINPETPLQSASRLCETP